MIRETGDGVVGCLVGGLKRSSKLIMTKTKTKSFKYNNIIEIIHNKLKD